MQLRELDRSRLRRESFREQKENLTWRGLISYAFSSPSLSLFSQLVSLSFSQSRKQGRIGEMNRIASRKRISHILFSLLFTIVFFHHGLIWTSPPPRSCGRGTHIARSYSNAESAQRRARELQERKRNVRKFARLPFGMMNEPLYSFCSQISFWLLKEKRCAKFNAMNVTTKPPSSGLRFRAYTSAVVADFRHKIFIVAVWFK